jgi:glycosidase
LRNVFTFLLTVRGIPMIYYGDELGMQGGDDPDNRRDFPPKAFEADGRTAEQSAIVDHIRKLTRLRKELEPLRRGTMEQVLVEDDQYVFVRGEGASAVVVAFNRADSAADLVVPVPFRDGTELTERLHGNGIVTVGGGRAKLHLPPNTSAIYSTSDR